MFCKKCNYGLQQEWQFCPNCGKSVVATRRNRTRPNGTGTVTKRPNGTYRATAILGYYKDDNGKKHRIEKSKTFTTKKEALEYLPKLYEKPLVNDKITFAEIYDEWKEKHAQKVGKSTMDCYSSAYKHCKYVHNKKMSEIKAAHLQKCIDECPNGKRTKQNIKALSSLLFKYAMQNDICDKNYAEFLYCGNDEQKQREAFTSEELQTMFDKVNEIPDLRYVLILCYTGFRLNELLKIKKSAFNIKDRYFILGSKTEAGKDRIVPISPKIFDFCTDLADLSNCEYVFAHDNGKFSEKAFRKIYYEALDKANIKRNPPHSCRHTFATLMKNVNAPNTDKQKLIGHSSFEMTAHYTHTDLEALRNITNNL